MANFSRISWGVALLALAGCGQAPTPALVAGAPNPLVRFDGNYQGHASTTAAAGASCPADRKGVIEVADHTLYFPYLPDTVFVVPLDESGTLHEVLGPTGNQASLQGQIADGRLTMTVKTPGCETSYGASLIFNHG